MPLKTPTDIRARLPRLTKACTLAQNEMGYLWSAPTEAHRVVRIEKGLITSPSFGNDIVYHEELGWHFLGNDNESPKSSPTFVIRNPYATQYANRTT